MRFDDEPTPEEASAALDEELGALRALPREALELTATRLLMMARTYETLNDKDSAQATFRLSRVAYLIAHEKPRETVGE